MTLTFPESKSSAQPTGGGAGEAPSRISGANRGRIFRRPTDLESLLPHDHPARTIWAWVERLDVTAFSAEIARVEGASGRRAIDPRILLALWLYATSEGVGSVRELVRLCEAHDAYRWICGGMQVKYHMLCDFRVAHRAALDAVLAETLAVLLHRL